MICLPNCSLVTIYSPGSRETITLWKHGKRVLFIKNKMAKYHQEATGSITCFKKFILHMLSPTAHYLLQLQALDIHLCTTVGSIVAPFPTPLEGILFHHKVTSKTFVRFTKRISGTHLCTWVERDKWSKVSYLRIFC